MKQLFILCLLSFSSILYALDTETTVFYRSVYERFKVDKQALLSLPFYTDSRALFNYATLDSSISAGRVSLFTSALGSVTLDTDSSPWDVQYDLNWNEAVLSVDFNDWATVYSGRKIIKWGNAFFTNPSSLMDPEHTLSDPDNSNKDTAGHDLTGLDIIFESVAVNIALSDSGLLGIRYYQYLENLDFSVIGYFEENEPPRLGFNTSYVLGERTQIYGECLVTRSGRELLADSGSAEESTRLDAVLGVYTTTKKRTDIIVELMFNGTHSSGSRFDSVLDQLARIKEAPLTEASYREFSHLSHKIMSHRQRPFYLFSRISRPVTSKVSLSLISMFNLTDFSGLVIPKMKVRLRKGFNMSLKCLFKTGNNGSESGIIPLSSSIQLGLSKTF